MGSFVARARSLTRWSAVAGLGLWMTAAPAMAQAVAGYSEYFIPGDEDNIGLVLCAFGTGGNACPAGYHTHTVISVTAWSDKTTIYYDHWENGYNFDPANPGATADETYTLNTGQRISFESANISLPRTGTAGSTCTNSRTGTVVGSPATPPTSPTCYDGRDHIYVAGGVVTVTRVGWIEERGVGVQGVAWEIYPIKPQLTTYVVPFGETSGWHGFQHVAVLIQATRNNTVVTVDLDHDGNPDQLDTNRDGTLDASSVTLQAGQNFLLDDTSAHVGAGGLAAGVIITGTDTLQVKYLAGNTADNYSTRGFSAFPRGFWTTDYYAPLDQPADTADGLTDYYLYNPNSAAITVNWHSSAGSGSFSIPATSAVSFRAATGGNVPVGSGMYFKGSDVFWGVGSNDAEGQAHEWGFSLLPSSMFYTEHFLGWAPDCLPSAAGCAADMGAFVTVAQDNTRVFVDLNNDGTADQTYTLDRLQTQFIDDPTDGDLSGARIWATGPFSMAYGQNSNSAPTGAPALDLGYVAIPASDFVSLVLSVSKSVSPQVVPTTSNTPATFTIKVDSQKYTVDGVTVTDTLPANWAITAGTTTITRPDLTTLSGPAAEPTVAGQTLTWSTGQTGGSMDLNQEITIRFTAHTTAVFATGTLSQNRVQAAGTRTFSGVTQTFTATDFVYVISEGTAGTTVGITKTSSVPGTTPVYPGDTLTYTTTVTNPAGSGTTLTGVTLFDAMPIGVTYVPNSGLLTGCTQTLNVRDEFFSAAYNNNGPGATADWATDWTETDSLGGGATNGLVQVTGGVLQFKRTQNVRDEFATQAYTNNGPNNTATWATDWTETDIYGDGATGAAGGFVWINAGVLQLRDQAANVADNFTTSSYARNDGNTDWTGDWTETGDDGNPGTGSITVDAGNNNRINFGPGAAGRAVTRTAPVSGNSVTISFTLSDQGINNGQGVIAEYDLGLGAGFQFIQQIDNNTLTGTNPLTVNTAGATSITLRFRTFGTYGAGNNAGVDAVNIAFNNAVGSQIQRTANLAGATTATLTLTPARANLVVTDQLVLEASSSASGPFTTLATYSGTSTLPTTFDLTPYVSATTTIRFRVTSGFNAANKTFSVDNLDITYSGTNAAIQRSANLTGATAATLTLTPARANLVAGDQLVLEASSSASGPFTTLATYSGTSALPTTFDLTPYISAATTIRLRVTSGFDATNKTFSVDNVNISYTGRQAADPPDFLDSAAGCSIAPGGSIILTFNVIVNDPLPTGLTLITNTASTTSAQIPFQVSASVTNIVTNPSTQTASVAGRVWLDANANGVQDIGESGIANVEVTLKDQFGTPVAVTITDVNGRYLFSGVNPGNGYYAEATGGLPAGISQTFPIGLSNNRTTTFNLVGGGSYVTADVGYRPAAGTVLFGDQVWVDANGNGLRDPGEVGLGGVTVSLYRDSNGNGVYDDGVDAQVATTTSAADGSYSFGGIAAGSTYFVIARTPVDGSSPPNPLYNPTTDTTYRFANVTGGSGYLTADFGFQPNGTTMVRYAIRDRVWFDLNGNGALNGGETGISGVTVELLDASSRVIGTTVTAADGTFSFTGVAGGGADYTVSISDNGGVLANYTGTTSYALTRERAVPNLAGDLDLTSTPSFGFRPTRSIGTTIFHDLNGNGILDVGETGIAGVVVGLYNDANGNGRIDAGDTLLGSVTTDANGRYFFAGLANGTYIASVPPLTGYNFTGPGGDSDGATAGIQKAATIAGGGDVWTVNFGFQAAVPRTLQGTVWNDANGNGAIDGGEAGYAGVTLNVLSGSAVVATVTTDASGAYSVAGLASGTYTVQLTDTNGVLTGTSSTYEKTEGTSPPFNYQEVVDLTAGDVTNVNFGFRRAAVTFSAIASLEAYLSGGSVTVEWRTSLEVGTVGFHLFRLDPASRRYRRLDEKLLPGLLVHPQGGTYRFRDVGAPTEGPLTYVLQELDIHGRLRAHGPYTVAVGNEPPEAAGEARSGLGEAQFDRRPATVSRAGAARLQAVALERRTAVLRRRAGQGTFVDVATGDEGLYYVSATQLAGPLGLPAVAVSTLLTNGGLALSHRGQPVPYLPDARHAGIYFYAEPVHSIYTDENVYQVGLGRGLTIRGVASTAGLASDDSFQETVHREVDQYPVPGVFFDPDADFCVWNYLFAGYDGIDSMPVTVPALGVAATGSASLTVHLVGATDSGAGIDHHITVTFNNKLVGETTWGGIGRHDLEIPLDPGDVLEGDNTVELKAILDGGVSESIVLLDSVDLSYARTYRAVADALTFTAPGGTTVEVSGFSSSAVILLDVTTPALPALVTGYAVAPASDGTWAVRFGTPADGNTRRYAAVRAVLAKAPVGVTAWRPSGLRNLSNRARYVLIAPDTLEAAAGTLADYRNGKGTATMVVGLRAIYDEFNGGIAEPTAIPLFLRYARSHWAVPPRYAALIGRGTWDYKNVGGAGDNLVPPLMAASADGLFASDVRMADLAGDDGVPEIALGRIPVLTSQELLDYAAKVEAQEGAGPAAWSHAVLMAADNDDAAGAFTSDSDAVAALLPPDRVPEKVYLTTMTADAGRQAIVDAVDAGVSIFNYIGHGAPGYLADEDLFDNATVASLDNAGRLPVFVAMTCSVGDFAIPGQPSLAETLLLKKDGGAVAAWAPSGLSQNDLAVRLDKSFVASAFRGDGATIGDIVVRGLKDLDVPDAAPMRYMYNLLGEPVSRVPQ